jgi:PAS domain-containing protein
MKGRTSVNKELRQNAEKNVKVGQLTPSLSATLADVQQLVHELEVHQVELEMQNEELNQIRRDLDNTLRQYINLYENAPVGYFTLDHQGIIKRMNLRGAQIMGRDRSYLENVKFHSLVEAHDRVIFGEFFESVFGSDKTEKIEVRVYDPNRRMIYLYIEASYSEFGDKCLMAVFDQTEQKILEQALRQREIELEVLYNTIRQGIICLQADDTILYANSAAMEILNIHFNAGAAVAYSSSIIDSIREDGTSFPHHEHPSRIAFSTNSSVHNVVMGIRTAKTDHYKWIRIDAVPYSSSGGEKADQVFSVFEDITPIKLLGIFNTLTNREKDVFMLMVKKVERQHIAEALKISPKTVDKHKENILKKISIGEIEDLGNILL